ncbi:hypothetical protein HDV00_004546 [Rhizophlyctis rosea]|nr:hypothetical protein HDV00_004546 [Rhizophlyctis rosea]
MPAEAFTCAFHNTQITTIIPFLLFILPLFTPSTYARFAQIDTWYANTWGGSTVAPLQSTSSVADPLATFNISNPQGVRLAIWTVQMGTQVSSWPGVKFNPPRTVNMQGYGGFTGFIMPISAPNGLSILQSSLLKFGDSDSGTNWGAALSPSTAMNQWSKYVVDFTSGSYVSAPPNSVIVQMNANDNQYGGEMLKDRFVFTLWIIFIESPQKPADYVPPPVPTKYVAPPMQTPPADVVYATKDQTDVLPDTGLDVQWSCMTDPSFVDMRGYMDLQNVTIRAYRDTNYGPYGMNAYSSVTWDGFNYVIQPLWNGNPPRTYSGFLVPNPWLACVAHNADFYLIGNNTGKATNTLVVWVPNFGSDAQFIVGGYADWVKTKQTAGGEDTVVVHVRLRMPTALVKENYHGK